MSNLPRIEAIDADSAVAICCDVLAFIQLAARAVNVSGSDVGNINPAVWNGLAWLAEVLSNTLAEVERRDP
jgi:hypothetical protein